MLDLLTLFEWVVSISCVLIASLIAIDKLVIDGKRDLHPIALSQQSNVAGVRRKNETAVYRNFTVPPGFPLTTGLALSLGYRIRNGNFGDIWEGIMSKSVGRGIEIENTSVSLSRINGLAKCVSGRLLKYMPNDGRVGIAVPLWTLPGLSVSLAALMSSLEGVVPCFLPAVPRTNLKLNVLVIDSWDTLMMMRDSHEWYQWIIVCDEKHRPPNFSIENVVMWSALTSDAVDDDHFSYAPPSDNSDDTKVLAMVTSPWNHTNSFTQGALVSSVAAYVKSFPLGQELTEEDHLALAFDRDTEKSYYFQSWTKLLSVLLYGGSVSLFGPDQEFFNPKITLLQLDAQNPGLEALLQKPLSVLQKLKLSWASTLFSNGIFTKISKFDSKVRKLRCVYIANHARSLQYVDELSEQIPCLRKRSENRLSSSQQNLLRGLLGSRLIPELYSPYLVMGPVASANFYDYRVFPEATDIKFAFYGPITTSIEAKLVETKENPDLSVESRQGMLCIRGFTIGKPVENDRLEKAAKIVQRFDGGGGWMPLLGEFCLWGSDGCLYEYK
ncbi:LAMI_0D03686g1_1 [Lachancea mirantina]|uniref:LAMI_0D03686g1_1 n=1 Tax=Lachancea mirantina TaxID=1230905 RepID=A0A1G4JA00_9SACH|nr:LAMI_0D03686g1_1 [Lachancea mirantina]